MFEREAREIGAWLAGLPSADLGPVLDIGSTSIDYATKDRPWTDREIFAYLRAINAQLIRLDLKDGPGIDIVADILTDGGFERAALARPGLVLLCNVLEHVEEPQRLLDRSLALLRPGGYLLASVPRSYPIHRCPIDNGLRPTPQEVTAMLAGAKVIRTAIVPTEYHWHEIARDPRKLMGRKIKWLFTPYLVTMVLFQKSGGD